MDERVKNQSVTDGSEIMTLSEISRYLKVSEKTVVRMVKAGDLPGGKVSSQWRFQKTVIDNWLTGKMQTARDDDLTNIVGAETPVIPLPKLIPDEHILVHVKAGSKNHVLSQLVRPLLATRVVANPAHFLEELLGREQMVSTALTDGVALPHVRDQETSGVKEPCIVLGICREGTDFEAIDGKPTRLFFLLCATSAATHLRIMAKLTLMLRHPGMIDRFCDCTTQEQVKSVLADAHLELSIQL